MKTYTLISTPAICTPGMIRFMMRLPKAQARKVFKAGWPTLPLRIINGILDGTIKYTVTADEKVIFTA